MIVIRCILSLVICIFVTYFFGSLYYEVTKQLGITNVFEVWREILGGWILAATMYVERRIGYGERLYR